MSDEVITVQRNAFNFVDILQKIGGILGFLTAFLKFIASGI
jgi:hypothetical protein